MRMGRRLRKVEAEISSALDISEFGFSLLLVSVNTSSLVTFNALIVIRGMCGDPKRDDASHILGLWWA